MKKLFNIAKRTLAALCVVSLLVSGAADSAEAAKIGKKTSAKTYIKSEDWPDAPSVDSVAAVLMDAETGTVLYAKNPDTLLYPASITKIMTALLTLENTDLDKKMTFKAEAVQSLPYNAVSINAQEGERMSIRACMNATLVYSANDAAAGLACEVGGTLKKFSKMMNKRAKELGCKNTHFNNPHGLSDSKHWTTAYDMCLIMKECLKYQDFIDIASTRLYTLKKNNKRKEAFTFAAKHKMLFPNNPEYYKYVVCGKTGYTDEAGNTLVTYAEKNGRGLICCTMKGGYGVSYSDTEKLFKYGFKNFKTVNATKKDDRFTADYLGISGDEDGKTAKIEIADGSYVVVPKGVSLSDLTTEVEYLDDDEDLYFAEATYYYEGTKVGSAKLKMTLEDGTVVDPTTETTAASEDKTKSGGDSVAQSDDTKKNPIEQLTDKLPVDIRILAGIGIAVVVIIILIVVLISRRRERDSLNFKKSSRRRRRR